MVNMENEKYCTVLIHYDKGVPPTSEEINTRLESKNDKVKAEALEELVLLMINGETYPKLLMSIIKFVVASTDHRVKKLLTIYWEVVDKCKENGDLKEEMILVCNALRNDLLHPNEYIRGSTLRLLCKMKYYRILEPLKEAVLRNLSHRHSYVRRNAAMCVYAIIKTFGIDVIPDAPEDIEQLLLVEGDLSTKRNAFLMLLHCDQERAIKYILSMQDQVSTMGDIFQLATLELVRKVCRTNPALKGRLLRIVFNLVGTTSTAVSYECASTLVSLSSSSVAVHQATQAYVTLLTEQSDNNVKLIVLDRLQEVRKKHKGVMEGMVMDIFRALSCPSIDVRKKVMDICLGNLVSSRNIGEVVGYLKKEVTKTLGYEAQSVEGNTEYRRLLIRALHACTAQYHDQAQSVVFLLMDFLTEADQNTASEVVMFLRELVSSYPDLRVPILQRLCQSVADVQQSRVLRGILWLFGEYCEGEALIVEVLEALVSGLKPLPLAVPVEATATKDKKEGDGAKKPAGKYVQKTVVLKDGTYGTENVWSGTPEEEAAEKAKANVSKETANTKKSHLRLQVLGGDCLLSAMVGVSMTKLSLKATGLSVMLKNEILLCLVNIYKLVAASSALGDRSDSAVRLTQCIRLLAGNAGQVLEESQLAATKLMRTEWASQCGRSQLGKVIELANQTSEWTLGQEAEEEQKSVGPDELIVFRQLRERKGGATQDTAMDEDDFGVARGSTLALGASDGELFAERLAKVQQMSGLADPVYVEAFLQVHSFDLVLELLLVNRTTETLQNVLVELSTQGDLKLVDRPVAVTLAPGQQLMTYASIKVSSTETGVIFGYLTFDKTNAEKECTVLNQLHVDILDYIERSWIGEMAFRTMWSEFEWENKININTTICDVGPFLVHIMRHTNMSIVGRQYKNKDPKGQKQKGKLTAEDVQEMIDECTGIKRLIDSSSFVAVNLYAKSIFGEDALANISIEKTPDGKLTGSVRIRSRTQGIALSLGDRITIVQRGAAGPQ